MIKIGKTKSNFIFQMIYQIVTLAIPLVIAPYLTRVLGDTSLGIYTYTYSIAFCFMSFARLGIDKYGQRVIATVRDCDIKLRKTFWSLYFVHVFFTLLALIIYFLFILILVEKNTYIFFLQGLVIFSVLFDVTWLFYGIENFKFIVFENLLVKISEILLIFDFVNNKSDLDIYTLVIGISMCFGYLLVFPFVIHTIKPVKIKFDDIKKHIVPLLVLFTAVIASTMYQMIDKTLLGFLSTEKNVAYYEYANKILNVPVNLIFVMGTILMPRACIYASKGDILNQTKYINISLNFVAFVGIGSMFGLLSVSTLFSVIYYGDNFIDCGFVMMSLSPIILLLGIENIIRTQYMIPNQMDKQFSYCLFFSVFLNFVFSLSLIPIYGLYGAVIGTVIAEISCTIIHIFLCHSFITFSQIIKVCTPYFLSGIIMYVILSLIKIKYNNLLYHLIMQIIIGGITYCSICFLLKKLFITEKVRLLNFCFSKNALKR